jgi:spermidine synthase
MDKPYAVLSIPVFSLIVYFATWLAVKTGIISRDVHRKFWNVLLLTAFAGAAGLGFLLALQVNYKFDLPEAASFLKLHVDFGIALLVIALLHLSWHLTYYLNIFRPNRLRKTITEEDKEIHSVRNGIYNGLSGNKRIMLLLPFCLGLTSMSSQIILLREFLSVFNGNELVIGIVLANWMLLTGAGAWIGRFSGKQKLKDSGLIFVIIALTVAAPVTLFALDALRNVLFTTGSMAGIFQVYFTSLLVLAPFCITSGLLFTRLTAFLSFRSNENSAGRVYAWESIGSVAGGVMFNFVLVFFLKPFAAFGVIIAVNALLLAVTAFMSGKKNLIFGLLVICVAFISSVIFLNPDIITRKMLFPGQEILKYRNTPFGDIVFTGSEEQKNLYEDNTLIYTTNNVISNEESVHYAMLQHEKPANVLLIGGCFPGVVGEILKYPVKRIDCVVMNPWLLKETKKVLGLPNDKRLNVISGDPLIYLREAGNKALSDRDFGKYDVILLNLPDPYTIQINRFYSTEFLDLLKPLLTGRGVVSLSLMATADYMGFSSGKVHSVMYSTLKHIFNHVVVIPGDRNYFLASDSTIRLDVATLQAERGIETEYVNAYYLDDQSIDQRSRSVMKAMDVTAPVNHDFEPIAFKGQLDYWLDYFGVSLRFLPVILLLILFLVFFRNDGIGIGLFTAGFSASSSEIIILLAFQIIYGYVFIAAGMFITLFMLGLAIGAVLGRRCFPNPSYKLLVWLQVIMAIASLMILGIIYSFHKVQCPVASVHIGFGLILLLTATLTGLIFQVSSVVKKGKVRVVTGSLYSSDLLGSALGALFVSVFLIPEMGMFRTLIVIAILCLISASVMILKRKSFT